MKTVEELVKTMTSMQREKLLEIVIDFHWMARRYADGRMSYVSSLFNDHTRVLQSMGIPLNETADGTFFAQDGMGRRFDQLDDSHAHLSLIAQVDAAVSEAFHVWRLSEGKEILPKYLQDFYLKWKEVRGYE